MGKKEKVSKPKLNKASIGGQAVLEGVMMRGESSMATAVRDQDGIIRLETKRITPTKKRNIFLRLPIIRGVVAFISSLFGGMNVLMRSAEVYGEEEPSKFEKWVSKVFKVNVFNVVGAIALILGLLLALGLFIFLPQRATYWIQDLAGIKFNVWAKNFIEGGIKLLIFILYLLFCLCVKDVRRTFMYHGAEHKTISCFEKGISLTVENVKKCKRVHDRCGTTFMIFVMLISIICFAVFESLVGVSLKPIYRALCKIAILPLVAGLSYELLKGLSKTSCWIFFPLKVPGLLLQRLTTKEPDDKMIEVAITAFNKVLEMDNDPTIKEVSFVVAKKRKELLAETKKTLQENGIEENSESEWIVSLVLNVKRSELLEDTIVSPKLVEQVERVVNERISGRPLWYSIGDTDFYGYTIKVDERVLIPRPETELLVEQALKVVKENDTVLDLCTGSGAIAIAVNKESGAKVTASDVSRDALDLATENAKIIQAQIEFIESNLFEKLKGKKFDLIISNPPYIKSDVILTLQSEVKDHEPMLALDGGKDGLDFYRKIASECKQFLTQNGVVLLEIGFDQADQVKSLFAEFSKVEVIKDYENNDRIIKAVL